MDAREAKLYIDRANVYVLIKLFLAIALVRYFINQRFYNRRYELYENIISENGGVFGGIDLMVSTLIVTPLVFLVLYAIVILCVILILRGINNAALWGLINDWTMSIRIAFLAAYLVLVVTHIVFPMLNT